MTSQTKTLLGIDFLALLAFWDFELFFERVKRNRVGKFVYLKALNSCDGGGPLPMGPMHYAIKF
jgi:hypothetical protein